MALFNSFTYDGIDSLEHGIYITGEAVYNAPERAVETINIAGRNGALIIDQGRFENIEVTYKAGVFASTQEEFAAKVREFRNILCSRYSYVRITDTYHPDEYRLGVYRGGFELDPVAYHHGGQFDITFDCKPQRFLTEGENPLVITYPVVWTDETDAHITDENGTDIDFLVRATTLNNPYPFESKPLITVTGSGQFSLSGQNVIVDNDSGDTIYIDCDTMEIYSIGAGGAIQRRTEDVTFVPNDFPTLPSGEFNINIPVTVNVTVTPRWWII